MERYLSIPIFPPRVASPSVQRARPDPSASPESESSPPPDASSARSSVRRDVITSIYSLASPEYPTDAQIELLTNATESENLPSSACCSALQPFDSANCECDATLPRVITQVGLTATTVGITGFVNLTRSLCGNTGTDC